MMMRTFRLALFHSWGHGGKLVSGFGSLFTYIYEASNSCASSHTCVGCPSSVHPFTHPASTTSLLPRSFHQMPPPQRIRRSRPSSDVYMSIPVKLGRGVVTTPPVAPAGDRRGVPAACPLARAGADAAVLSLCDVGGEESEYGSGGEKAMKGRMGWPAPASLLEVPEIVSSAYCTNPPHNLK